jgi:hypothetical protein
MNIAMLDHYQVAADFEQRAIKINFPVGVWCVAAELAEVRGGTSPSELEKLTGQSVDQVREALGQLVAKELVVQSLISWKEFTAAREEICRTAKPPVGKNPPNAPIQVVPTPMAAVRPALPQASAPRESSVPNRHMGAQEGVSLRLGTISPQKTAVSTNAWLWQKPDSAQVAASTHATSSPLANEQYTGRLLRPMLEQIENLKDGGVEGQLLVYQVFLRVPYQLLHDEGIKALHLVDERTVIQNPVLYAAIVKAAKEVTGVELV